MATHQERAARMGYVSATNAAAKAVSAPIPSVQMHMEGEYGPGLSSYYDRSIAEKIDDQEAREILRRERPQLEGAARKHGIPGHVVHEVMAVVREHEVFPKSKETQDIRRAQTAETLRKEFGGHEGAQQVLRNYVNLTTQLQDEIPTLIARVSASGAGEDVRVIKALAHYGATPDEPTQPPPAAA